MKQLRLASLGALLFVMLGCASASPQPDIVLTNTGLSSAETREPVEQIRLAANSTVIIYLHGTKNPALREDCQYRNNRVPETLQSAASLPDTQVFFLCSTATDGNLEGSYIAKRGAEVNAVLTKLIDAGVAPERIFLAGHSAGAWVGLMLFAEHADRFNALIGYAPECCGRRDLESDYPRWRTKIRPQQIEQMLMADSIDALLFAYEDDIYNRPAELGFLTEAYKDSVRLIGYDCEGGHNTHIDDCRAKDTGAMIRKFITERIADERNSDD